MDDEKIKGLHEHIKALQAFVEVLHCQLNALHSILMTDHPDLEARYQMALYENYHNSQNNAWSELALHVGEIEQQTAPPHSIL